MGQESRTPVTGAPFSAVQTVQKQQLLSNGNKISRNVQSKVYRDGQGRMRIERTITPPPDSGKQSFTEVTISDPVAGYRYLLSPSNMTALQLPLRRPEGSSAMGAPAGRRGRLAGAQTSTVDLGTQTVNGLSATGKQVTETIPAKAIGNDQPIQIVRTIWTSTALKIPVQVKTTDPRFGTTDRELTNIQQSEPDPSLFVVPKGYTIKTPQFGPASRERTDQ
jgi:hypothetical protein